MISSNLQAQFYHSKIDQKDTTGLRCKAFHQGTSLPAQACFVRSTALCAMHSRLLGQDKQIPGKGSTCKASRQRSPEKPRCSG